MAVVGDRTRASPDRRPGPTEPSDGARDRGGQWPGGSPGRVAVIGAGPAGLTSAYLLGKRGVRCTVLEADAVPGGIARTVERDGWRFDVGGHRFFTKVREVEE
ncbi:MAG: FAD-dependent oxidoreductase, partial [Acidimicrobiales bacterium]